MLAGASAGFMNVAKIKGSHNAIKTGMLAAEEIYGQFMKGTQLERANLVNYEESAKKSGIYEELRQTRNF